MEFPEDWYEDIDGRSRMLNQEKVAAEIERLRAMVLDACKVFDRYDLPEHAFHYRRDILGLDEAKRIARGGPFEQSTPAECPDHPTGRVLDEDGKRICASCGRP